MPFCPYTLMSLYFSLSFSKVPKSFHDEFKMK
jgi:hypothetical protein